MVILQQTNHLWASDKLGSSNLTIGADGCLTCCVAMINNTFGQDCTPDQVASHPDWYTPTGLVLWTKINLKSAIFDWREYMFDPIKIEQTLKDPERAVCIEVQLPRGGTHWMYVIGATPGLANDVFLCADPYSGQEVQSTHYGPVIGAAYFSKRVPALI